MHSLPLPFRESAHAERPDLEFLSKIQPALAIMNPLYQSVGRSPAPSSTAGTSPSARILLSVPLHDGNQAANALTSCLHALQSFLS